MTTVPRRPSLVLPKRGVELSLVVVILLVATFLRFRCPEAVPPGPSHDELRMMQLGELIVDGERPLHWKISYSAEPLFMYLLALTMPVWGFTPFGARLVSRFAGLLLVAVSHRLVRRLFGRRVALFTSGVLSVTWWPLFFSRVALRGITLPLVLAGGVIFLWRGLGLGEQSPSSAVARRQWAWLVTGAGLMGLSWYTFTGARSTIILLPMLLIHLCLLRLVPCQRLWRAASVTLIVAVLVAAPFVYQMAARPGTAETRLHQLGGVMDALLAGDPIPLIRQSVRTLGLFVATGDPNWRYNLSGRPPFGPLLGGLAVLGVLVSLLRWRQPCYFLILTWTLLGLAPTMLTPEAPSFVRGIGALPAAAVFPGVGAVALWDWIMAHRRRIGEWIMPVLLALCLALSGLDTFHDYFFLWPIRPEVHEIYQTALTEAFRDLSCTNLTGVLWGSEPFPDDRHLLLADRILSRDEIDLRWFNAERGLILPPTRGHRRYLIPEFMEPDDLLFARWMQGAITILEGDPPPGAPSYRLYEIQGDPEIEQLLSEITAGLPASLDVEGQRPVALPVRFGDTARLLGYELADDDLSRGEDVHLIVYWRVANPIYEPVASFAHLIDAAGHIVGQYDGFDVPPWHWEPDCVVAQVYRFPVGRDARPGPHWLEVGLYDSQTMERVAVVDEARNPVGDRLVLRTVFVE